MRTRTTGIPLGRGPLGPCGCSGVDMTDAMDGR